MLFSTLAKRIPQIVDFVNEITFLVGNLMFTDLAQVTWRYSTKCFLTQTAAWIDLTWEVLSLATAINTDAIDPIFSWLNEHECNFGCWGYLNQLWTSTFVIEIYWSNSGFAARLAREENFICRTWFAFNDVAVACQDEVGHINLLLDISASQAD